MNLKKLIDHITHIEVNENLIIQLGNYKIIDFDFYDQDRKLYLKDPDVKEEIENIVSKRTSKSNEIELKFNDCYFSFLETPLIFKRQHFYIGNGVYHVESGKFYNFDHCKIYEIDPIEAERQKLLAYRDFHIKNIELSSKYLEKIQDRLLEIS